MKQINSVLVLAIAAVLVLAVLGGTWWFGARAERLSSSPAATANEASAPAVRTVPPGSPEPRAARARNEQLALEMERALAARDPRQRETALAEVLPELLLAEPARVVDLLAHQPPGEARDALRDAMTRLWVRYDRDATVRWIRSMEDESERRSSARVAVNSLAAGAPDQAIYVADQFGVGRDDGTLEHLVQMWAEADLDAALHWLATQPDDAHTAPLRARIELVRARKQAAGG
jgi:hypothetical protein